MFKVKSAEVLTIKFVFLDTNAGEFKVYENGSIERWNDSAEEFQEYDEYSTYYNEVKKAGEDFFQGECE